MRDQSREPLAIGNQTGGVGDNVVTVQKRPQLIHRQGGDVGLMHLNLVPP
jgi:hypothetical protein